MAGIYFISLGCDKNRIDAEIMMRSLSDAGHFFAATPEEADCAVINTCGFIDSAKEEAIGHILEMAAVKASGALRAIVVTGCLAQRYAETIKAELPEVDTVVGLGSNQDIADVVARTLSGECIERFGAPEELVVEGARLLTTPPHYAYLKIAEGCSNHCTYCAIPGIRGAYRSRPADAILNEARTLAAQGVAELILVAQDTTSYGKDLADGWNLPKLLTALCGIAGFWKIRVLYAYPEKITDELIETMARLPKIARYVDIPMQHADAAVLRRMGRFGDKEQLLGMIGRLRAAMPDITLRSTFIVGFPGETKQQFANLLDFLRLAQLDRAGCFPYSPEEGTAAARLKQTVGDVEKQRRFDDFMTVQQEILLRKQEAKTGAVVAVLCDGYDPELGMFACRGDSDAPDIDTAVYLPLEADLMPGERYTVCICGVDGVDLIGELTEDDDA